MSRRAFLTALAFVHTFTLTSATAIAVTLSSATAAPVLPQPMQVTVVPDRPAPVVHHAVVKPVVFHRAAPKPVVRAPRPVVRHIRRTPVVVRVRRVLSPEQLMMAAVNRIPGYEKGAVVWALTPGLAHWGIATMGGNVVYIAADVPTDRMYDVVAHEWSHILSTLDYGNNAQTAIAAMDRYFGGTGMDGAEIAADCMAKELGAVWTHYTPCNNTHWRNGARVLLAHGQV